MTPLPSYLHQRNRAPPDETGTQQCCRAEGFATRTQQVQHQVLAGRERVLEVEEGVAGVLDLPQRLEVPQQDVTEPLRVHTRDPPLLGLLVLQPAGPWWAGNKKNNLYCNEIGKTSIF